MFRVSGPLNKRLTTDLKKSTKAVGDGNNRNFCKQKPS